jgi:periplasmic protein TonB
MNVARAAGLSPDRRLWSRATLAAIVLHLVAVASALIFMRGEIDEDVGGAPAIELSMEAAAPKDADSPDAPPGPLADDAAASVASVASKAEESKEEQIARVEAEEADLARSQTPEKPVENAKTAQSQQRVSNEQAASEAAAPPKSDAERQSDRPVAPTQGVDAKARAATLAWQKQLIAHLNRAKRYPAGAGRRAAEVRVSFTLDRLGHILNYSVRQSSGDTIFDAAALAMMKRADPAPAPPPALADEGLSFEVPVQFRADRR